MGKNWRGSAPMGELGPHQNNVAGAEAYLHAKFHLDPSNRVATILQRYHNTPTLQTGQTDSTDNGPKMIFAVLDV